jgi:DNA repair protein RadC
MAKRKYDTTDGSANLFGEITTRKVKSYEVKKYSVSCVREKDFASVVICNKSDVTDFCKKKLSNLALESFLVIALNNGNEIIGYNQTDGTTNQCVVFASSVFRFALLTCASSIIIAHNHPGQSSKASQADWNLTKRLIQAGKMLEIPLVDHLIITESTTISLREDAQWSWTN